MRRARVFWIALAAMGLAGARLGADDANEECLACHADTGMRDVRFEFANGSGVPVHVDGRAFSNSVHGSFDCVDCHQEFRGDHPQREFAGASQYRRSLSQVCRECHELEGPHLRMASLKKAPLCVDCHGAHAVRPVDRTAETCMGCHAKELQVSFADGSERTLGLDSAGFQESVHRKLRCVDCHFGFSGQRHPERTFATPRDFSLAQAETCRRCHFDKYTMGLESVHAQVGEKLRDKAPVCTDCHGGHAVKSGRHDKLGAARRCRNCHQVIYDVYAGSVHGRSLMSADNQDVPVCSDCHTAHKIRHPELSDFRNDIPTLCGDCHADQGLMSKYGLSTAVLDSYLEDFHGVTVSYYKKEKENASGRRIAVCTDCHGIHDIGSLRQRGSSEAVKATLLKRCRQCHQDATESFPDAWISHYQPTFSRAPLVYSINFFYGIFIPFMVAGLVLQIALHVWRYTVDR